MKFRLGLFERPYRDEPTEAKLAELADDEARVGLELARRSMVLVANDGILPLAPSLRRIAVIGPGADSPREFLGDYSHLVHVETLVETRRSGSQAFGIIAEGASVVVEDELAGRPTLLDALRARLDGLRDPPRPGDRHPRRVRRGRSSKPSRSPVDPTLRSSWSRSDPG